MKISILIPVYNERYLVRECLRRVVSAPLPEGLEREIIIVEDGSTDGTARILDEWTAVHPGLARLIRHEKNQGKGAALRTAVKAAAGDVLLVQDADLEYNPSDYPALLAPILEGEADVVLGSRFQGGGRRRAILFWHAVANKTLTTISNMFTNLNLTDAWTGYKAVRSPFIKNLPLRCGRFCVELELVAKWAKQRCRIYEVPISYSGRTYGEGKKIGFWDAVRSIGVMVYFWLIDDIYGRDQSVLRTLGQLEKMDRFNDWMSDAVKSRLGSEVLEIGAGTGNLTEKLWRRDKYIASDNDETACLRLSRRFASRPNVNVLKIDVSRREDFPGLEKAVDTVVCLNVLEHIDDQAAALLNIKSALRPGGRLVLLVPHLPWAYGTLDRAVGHRRRYERGELGRLLEEAGFIVEEVFDFNRAGLPAWIVNGKIFKRETFGIIQLKIFHSLIWLFRRLDRFLPWPGQSLIAVARVNG